uniref:Junctophilin n=1 Tax=Acrobeloides nanus TaxID=290746 RepID=A0A914C7F9_9BILA
MNGGRFDFDDGGSFCGSWQEGKAHGHGVCTGPDGKGEYAGAWHYGFEVSGVYTWPSGNNYQGQWQNGKRHGLGIELRGHWIYKGEWTQGLKGRYGHRQSANSQANYMGTWSAGLHDGYGTETYVDGGTYRGQWLRGMRHGYGIRKSASYGVAAKFRSRSQTNASLTSLRSDFGDDENHEGGEKSKKEKKEAAANEKDDLECRGGFVLRARSDAPAKRRRSLSERSLAVKRSILSGLRIKKQHSTGDIHQRVASMSGSLRSSGSTVSCTSEDSSYRHADFALTEERIDANAVETYKGEWKNDKRSGFGVCERNDGLRYEGEWLNNRKNGYGITFLKDGTKEEGRYKNNVLVCSTRRKGLLFVRSSKLRERIEASVEAANRAASIAQQKADIAESRTMTARERSDAAIHVAEQAKGDADMARILAKQFDPNFKQPGVEAMRHQKPQNKMMLNHQNYQHMNHISFESTSSVPGNQMDSQAQLAYQAQYAQPALHHRPRIAESQHQLDQFSSSVDTTHFDEVVTNGSGSQANIIEFHVNPLQTPTSIPDIQTPTSYQSTRYTPSEEHPISSHLQPNKTPNNINEGASTSATLKLAADGRVLQGNAVGNRMSKEFEDHSVGSTTLTPSTSPRLRNAAKHSPQGSSTMSLSDDHFDQYRMNTPHSLSGGPTTSTQSQLRRNRPSLTRQSDISELSQNLGRRGTLASPRDHKLENMSDATKEANRTSMPDLTELEGTHVRLRREDAARLASQRRQEQQRLIEEEELLRANPLRYVLHPTLRGWLSRWKVPILLLITNIFLLYILVQLLTYERSGASA